MRGTSQWGIGIHRACDSGNGMLLPCAPAGVKRNDEDIVTDRRLDSLP